MASTADFKNGLCINFNNDLWTIIEFQHVKPGKGPAFVRTKIKSFTTGRLLENTFTSGVKIDTVRIERRGYQYLYKDDLGVHFMNNATYDQIFIEKKLIDSPQFLVDGINCEILFHAEEEKVLRCELPQFIKAEVTYTEPGIKGDTATNTMKPATLDCGAEIKVPLFINIGDKIKVDTRKGEYNERVK
jgi:elongation factor P